MDLGFGVKALGEDGCSFHELAATSVLFSVYLADHPQPQNPMISLDGVKLPCGVGCRILWLQVWGSRLQVWVMSHVLALCLGAKEKTSCPIHLRLQIQKFVLAAQELRPGRRFRQHGSSCGFGPGVLRGS